MPTQSRNGQPGNYNATPATRSDGDPSGFEFDNKGNVLVNLAVALSGLLSGAENNTILVAPYKRADAFQATFNSADATTRAQVKAGTSSKKIYVTDIEISIGTAMSVKIQDSTASAVILLQSLYMPANSVFSKTFATPLECSTAKDLEVIASVAGNVTVNAQGYVI